MKDADNYTPSCLQLLRKSMFNRLKIYYLDPAKFLSSPGLACQAGFKKSEVKLELLTDIDMLLMVEKGIRGAICHAIRWYAKPNI